MSWFLIALVAPLLWAAVNHIDKYLLSRYFSGAGIGPLMIFSSISALLVLPIAAGFSTALSSVPMVGIGVLIGSSFLYALGVFLYLSALQGGETSIVVPLFQLIPVFGYIFGYFFLGESLSTSQLFGGVLIIAGAIFLSLNFTDIHARRFRMKTAVLMSLSSFAFALYGILFKLVASDSGFWESTFWEHIGLALFGLLLCIVVKTYRQAFARLIRERSVPIFSLNLASEIITFIGNLLTAYASLLAPIALVFLVSSYQPLFALIIGIGLAIFFPHVAREDLSRKFLLQKVTSITLIFIGSLFLV